LIIKLDHVGIVVKRLDREIVDFYVKVFGCEQPKYFKLENPDEEIDYCHMRILDNYVELLAPKRGPFLDYLKEKGQGALAELCFEVDDIKEFYNRMKKQGVILVDSLGRSLPEERPYSIVPGDDNKYAYIPVNKSFGTIIEIIERCKWR
jgi:catechol 2,3-dioxygenase-like lactoylglutathione lyase family enzyme